MNNFHFLKNIDQDLYSIICDAEKLYRDEYFEQCITQTRRFGENVCKKVLGNRRTTENTFDDMLATLKDNSNSAEQEKEFIDDLYFLKREGNNSTHSSEVKQDGILALECLQRAFEIAINYSVYYKKYNSNLLKLRYDTELLITQKKSKKSLAEKYNEKKEKSEKSKTSKKTEKKATKQFHTTKTPKQKKKTNIVLKIFLTISSVISLFLVLMIYLLSII